MVSCSSLMCYAFIFKKKKDIGKYTVFCSLINIYITSKPTENIIIQCTELAEPCSHLQLRNKVFRHFFQQTNGRLVLTEEHQLQVQVSLQ